jgi:hypothetical protein
MTTNDHSERELMPPRLFDDCQEADIGYLYRDGLSTPQIARLFGAGRSTILGVLKRNNAPIRSVQQAARLNAYALNREAFKEPLTPIAKYWAGFLMADGCVTDAGVIVLNLQQRDHGHIEKFRSFVGSEAPTVTYVTTKSVGIRFCSREMADDLAELGIIPRKSLVSQACASLVDSPEFWRGMFDGDGHVSAMTMRLAGGVPILEQWRRFARQFCRQPSLLRNSGRLFEAMSHGNDMRYLITVLYRDAPEEARLDRKFPVAMRMMRIKAGRPHEIGQQRAYQEMLDAGQLCFFETKE